MHYKVLQFFPCRAEAEPKGDQIEMYRPRDFVCRYLANQSAYSVDALSIQYGLRRTPRLCRGVLCIKD